LAYFRWPFLTLSFSLKKANIEIDRKKSTINNNKREEIAFIEKKYSIKLNFHIDKEATADSYSIEKIKLSEKNKSESTVKQPLLQDINEIYTETSESKKTNLKNKKIKNKKFFEP
jgi:hypothetical protein